MAHSSTDAGRSSRGESLREDAWRIWLSGLEAVRADRLVERAVQRDGDLLVVDDLEVDLSRVRRIAVVGAGKAGAGMAAGLENVFGEELLAAKQVAGLVNVPADCVRQLRRIKLNAARPAGVNEPRPEGVAGTRAMLEMVSQLGPGDLCIALISGGGSALLPAPAEGISLEDKLAVTRLLSAAGANIEELNTVRKQLSRVKGGRLARACRAGQLITLIISDVLGDPLDVIASGPTVENRSAAADALRVLEKFGGERLGVPRAVIEFLRQRDSKGESDPSERRTTSVVTNIVIGNNAMAVDAAGVEAERLGYRHAMHSSTTLEGDAEDVGRHLAQMADLMWTSDGPNCLITGGEPVVRLAPEGQRGKGGRNQQVVLAALELMQNSSLPESSRQMPEFALLSAGTDGEDGPTDAAGAVVDAAVIAAVKAQSLNPADYLARNDAYRFFEATGGLLKTGPTHTNVCDVRVLVVGRR